MARSTARGGRIRRHWRLVAACLSVATLGPETVAAEVPQVPIRLASILDLDGRSQLLGRGMRLGLQAALHGREVHGRPIELLFFNDNYTPSVTAARAREALDAGIVAMVGNVGTPTAARSLPLLRDAGVPAIGFFTGADLLRVDGNNTVFNIRASYDEEIAHLVAKSREHGIEADQVCAIAQNDAFGEAGLRGLSKALDAYAEGRQAASALRAALGVQGHSSARNGLSPAGFFERESPALYHGYLSLQEWEARSGRDCAVVLVIGVYQTIGRFQAYSRLKGENWLIATLSFAGAEALAPVIRAGPPDDRVLMMQVVPPLDASLPLIARARAALGRDLGYISLEGYIAGEVTYAALLQVPGEITARSLTETLAGGSFTVGGQRFSFERGNQALHHVHLTYLDNSGWERLVARRWRQWENATVDSGIGALPQRVMGLLGLGDR